MPDALQSPERHKSVDGGKLSNLVKDTDLLLVIGVCFVVLLLVAVFAFTLFESGLLAFPDMAKRPAENDVVQYYKDALDYRERRVAMALLLRTFLTAFSFVIGLALSTMGGIFILRQVTALTTLTGGRADRTAKAATGGDEAVNGADGEVAQPESATDKAIGELIPGQFAFTTYSPGVAFLAGGVAIMFITQAYSIPVATVEVTPVISVQWCLDEEDGSYTLCSNIQKEKQLEKEDAKAGSSVLQTERGVKAKATVADECQLPKNERTQPDVCGD